MTPPSKYCCVPGCRDEVSKRHRITNNETCRKIWLERINNKKLFDETAKLTSYRVCGSHFEPGCFITGKLIKTALPTLNLRDYVRTGCDFLFNPPVPKGRVTPTKIRELLQLPSSTSCDSSHVGTVKKPKFTYGKIRRLFDANEQVDEQPFSEQTNFSEKATSARISQQLSTNLLTSRKNFENVSEKKSLHRCFSLKESSKIVPDTRIPEYSKQPSVVLKINNKHDACSTKENLGSPEILTTHHPITSTSEHTEIPLILCDIDTGNSTGFLKKSLECRTCLEVLTEDNNINVETEVVAKITILDALKKLADIQVPATDLLPQQICKKCFSNLKIAINFSTQVISSDEKLKSRLPSLTDPLLIKPEPSVIKIETEEFNTLDNNVNKPLEDVETETFKMEVVEENIEKFESSVTADNISSENTIKTHVYPENWTVDDYLKRKYLYESTMPIEPPEEPLKKLPPEPIVCPEYILYHNMFRNPRDNSRLCPECGKIYKTTIGCQLHIKKMHGKKIKTSDNACLCPKCGKMFKTKKGCQQHINRAHAGVIKKIIITYLCPDCDQFISGNKKKLLEHMANHHSNKRRRIRTPHKSCLCPECGKIFKSKWNCNAHLRDFHSKNMVVPRKRGTLCPDCGRTISGSKKKFLAHCVLYHSKKFS